MSNRTKNSINNLITGLFYKIITIIVPFVLRTVILNILGKNFLGLTGVFSSILQLLNLTELGLTNAIVYSLYEPIANKDNDRIDAILNFIRKAYSVVGIIILICGFGVMPFLRFIIKEDYLSGINIYILFVLYLLNTSLSYMFYAYRSCLFVAMQHSSIKNIINSLFKCLELFLQVLVIVIYKDLYLFVCIAILITIVNNVFSYFVSRKIYGKYNNQNVIEKKEKRNVLNHVVGIMADKICCVSRNSLDSIFISSFLGIQLVAQYENYSYIVNAAYSIVNILVVALSGSVGNSVVLETKEKNYKDMKQLMYIFSWIYGWISISLLYIIQPFMEIWMGKNMLLADSDVYLFVIYFYILCMGLVRAIYVQATGLWWRERKRAVIETFANLLLNIVLINIAGMKGVILGTCISLFFINFLYGSHYIYKYYFDKQNIREYFNEHLKFALITIISGIITGCFCVQITGNVYSVFVKRIIVCLTVPNLVYFVFTVATNRMHYILDVVYRVMRRK